VSSRSADITALSEELAEYLKPKLETLFTKLAVSSGWPSNIIEAVTVVINPDLSLTLEYPDTLKDQIENLEYGAIGEIPNAVIRPFMLRSQAYVEAAIKDKTLGALLDSVVNF
jgi:hypothetical protein